jgi:two-component system, NarL family, response regulator NreC
MVQERERLIVMLVDDHRILRQGLAGLLKEEPGIEVLAEAENGVEALNLARELRPDVIIMDVNLPGMNGIEATRIIAREMPHVNIIGLSMHYEEDVAWAMREAGAKAYLTKGCPVVELISAIHACRTSMDTER